MEPQEKMDTQQFIIDRLQDVQRKAEASNFAEALATMKEVKAADTKNIYLIAIEKQIAKLSDPALPAENRAAIIKSLHPMINRAISDVQRHAAVPKPEDSQKIQKEAALEKLKSQYFQRSDDYVEKKEYQRALEEIRRIYIIEPGSVVAKEYEKKIEQLAALQARGESPTGPIESVKETTETVPVAHIQKEQDPGAIKSNMPKILIIAAAVVILSVGAWLILSKGSSGKSGDQGLAEQPALTQENATPTLPTTTTSTPQSGKETAPTVESVKQSVKNQKTAQEEKSALSEKKPVQTPTVSQPVRTQTQPAQQPSSQPVVPPSTTQPVQQQAKPAVSSPAPMPFVAIESQPELIHREPAVYPEIAKKIGLQGRVVIEVTIDAQGKPIQAKVIKSASDIFNEAAIEAVMKYSFKPAMMSTGPVTAKVMIPIDFRLTR
jgi:TonB family protein